MGIKRRLPVARGMALAAVAALGAATLGITGATTSALGAAAPHARSAAAIAAATGPELKLIPSEKTVTVPKFGKGRTSEVYIDPGIWVASMRSAFQLDVSRTSLTRPIRATEVIRTAQGTVYRPLKSWMLDQWNGLRHFLTLTVRTPRGRVVAHQSMTFCPDYYDLSKATVNSANTSTYPEECAPGDPFPVGEVWGLARGWAVDEGYGGFRLSLGTYKLTESIGPRYAAVFGISPRAATATVTVKVVKFSQCCTPLGCCEARPAAAAPAPAGFVRVKASRPTAGSGTRNRLPELPAARILTHAPADALPDLIPLPSYGVTVANVKKSRDSYLDFAATVWIGGNSPLDVEGYRTAGARTMKAYQYFYKDGKIIGRMPVGSMGFANYNAWHFKQFAQYILLTKHKKVAVRSGKISFCIAPTDPVDMLLPKSTWQPSYTGIYGNCGSPSAIWVQELLPVGWGDTYYQTVPYQSFDITSIPNGTYYIEIIANPEHLLHETNTANDVSLRKVIIGGTRGHRTVRVPALDGIDPENGHGGRYLF
jgi:hypothetical protein